MSKDTFLKKFKKGCIGVKCDSKDKAIKFLEFLHDNGLKWVSGESLLDEDYWKYFEGDTVYLYNVEHDGVVYGCDGGYGIEVVNYDDVKYIIEGRSVNVVCKVYGFDGFVCIGVKIDCDDDVRGRLFNYFKRRFIDMFGDYKECDEGVFVCKDVLVFNTKRDVEEWVKNTKECVNEIVRDLKEIVEYVNSLVE